MRRVLVGDRTPKPLRKAEPGPDHTTAQIVITVVGAALALVGWTDVLLLWYPVQLGNPEWEFGTISASFDALPLGTIGLGALAAGLATRGRRRVRVGLAILLWVIAGLLLAAYTVYLLDMPLAWRGVDPVLRSPLKLAMVKTSVFALTYTVLYGSVGWFLWRRPVTGSGVRS